MAVDSWRDIENVEALDGFTRNQRYFIQWLSLSKYDRIPPTQRALADELGLNENTLSRWKKIPGLMEAATSVARHMLKRRLPEIFAALGREAESGSYQHIKLALELTGEHEESSSVDVTTKGESLNVGSVSDEQRIAATIALFERARARSAEQDMGAEPVMVPESRSTNGGAAQ